MSAPTTKTYLDLNGWINLHKPLHMTSATAVAKVKRLTRAKKVGHAGTLDPLADGVLPIALGEATKTAAYMTNAIKGYEFTICFGQQRTTDDAEGEVIETSPVRPTQQQIANIIPSFSGSISQIPPIFSAIKVHGVRAYDLARKGKIPELNSRSVTIHSLNLMSYQDENHASFSVSCSKGTYVRSLARDMALAFGTVGYVSQLRRVRVGNFYLKGAISLDFIEEVVHSPRPVGGQPLADLLMPLSTALDDIPAIFVDGVQADSLRHGRMITVNSPQVDGDIAAYLQNELIAIGIMSGTMFKPKRVFPATADS